MTTTRVLVVDEDPWTQRMVSAVLVEGGLEVDLASDGWEASICVGRAQPHLIITDVRLPTTDGWSLVATLRKRDGLATMPAIFLADAWNLQPGPGFHPSSDQILAKPFRIEQLESAVEAALRPRGSIADSAPSVASQVPPSEPPQTDSPARDANLPHRVVLNGTLTEFGLSSILIVLELERKSGLLVLVSGSSRGRIFLRAGRVIRAEIEGAADAGRGAVAVYDLLNWSNGQFEFNAGDVPGEDEIGSSTSFLLMEGARLLDERKQRSGDN